MSPDTLFDVEPVAEPRTVPVRAHVRRVTTDTSPLPRHRITDPETSAQAAKAVAGSGVEREILEVFVAQIRAQGTKWDGLTDDELCALMPQRYGPTVKSARSRLFRNGYLGEWTAYRISAEGVVRQSARGQRMKVWTLRRTV